MADLIKIAPDSKTLIHQGSEARVISTGEQRVTSTGELRVI